MAARDPRTLQRPLGFESQHTSPSQARLRLRNPNGHLNRRASWGQARATLFCSRLHRTASSWEGKLWGGLLQHIKRLSVGLSASQSVSLVGGDLSEPSQGPLLLIL
uniref:Uncharacterized protein n=1 Tax=Sphaerodactylus townsendi TaxID=933632 RepID=A0ACB8FBV4_9SAUR